MRLGDEVRVNVLKRLTDATARVVEVESGAQGVLLIKGELRIRKDRTVNAWVIRCNKEDDTYVFGNSYFGKFSISRSLADRYILIVRQLYDNPDTLTPDDISCLKGMGNRCIKKDQWDWFTTYKYLGYPDLSVLRHFVSDLVVQRDELKQQRFDGLPGFRKAYHTLLSSILFHLSDDVEVDDEDVDVPVPGIDSLLWLRLSLDSRKNIKLAERIYAKSSLYTLMHYFVALEQEFRNHFVDPITDLYANASSQAACHHERYQRTHDVLTGKSTFTLGTVRFLGEFVDSRQACDASDVIGQFSDQLGARRSEFVALCSAIATNPICGVPLPQLRNALAHGDAGIISRLDGTALDALRSFLFEPPNQAIPRILSASLRFTSPPNDVA